MKNLLICGLVCVLPVAAFVVAVAVAVVRLRAKQRAEVSDDPLARMFEENRRVNAARQADAVAALPEDDPMRAWVERGGEIGYVGFSDYLFAMYFTEEPGDLVAPVRGVRYEGDREPKLKGLPQPDEAFGVDLSQVPASERALTALAGYPGLAALSVQSKPNITDASLKLVARLTDLVGLDVQFTEVTARGVRHLIDLPNLRYLALGLPYEYAEAAEHLARMPQLAGLGGDGIGDDTIRALAPLTGLTHLNVGIATDAGLARLRPFGRLAVLKVFSADVTDAGVMHLGALGALQKLTLVSFEGRFRGPGLAGLAGLKQLRELHLSGNKLTGEGYEHFAGMTGLRHLYMNDNPVTDAGIARLRLPPGVESVGMGGGRFTDAGLTQLQLPESVTSLALNEAPITDACIPTLAKFTHLRGLGIAGTKFTLAGAHRLSEALPDCTISTSFPK